jgi:hypothetical protein
MYEARNRERGFERGFRGRGGYGRGGGFRSRYGGGYGGGYGNRRDNFNAQTTEGYNEYVTFKEKITQIEEAFLACLPEEDPSQTPETRLKHIEHYAALDPEEECKCEEELAKVKYMQFLSLLI